MRADGWTEAEREIVEQHQGKFDPEIVLILRRAGFERSTQAVRRFRARAALAAAVTRWTDREWDIVRETISLGPSTARRRLAEAGFQRSTRAVERARDKVGRPEETDPAKKARREQRIANLKLGFSEHRNAVKGWPEMVGTDVERDRQHVRNLLTAMLAEVRAKPSSQEMAA